MLQPETPSVDSYQVLRESSASIGLLLSCPNLIRHFKSASFLDTSTGAQGTIGEPSVRRKECGVYFAGDKQEYIADSDELGNMYIVNPTQSQQEAIDIVRTLDQDREEDSPLSDEDMKSVLRVLRSPKLYEDMLDSIYDLIKSSTLTPEQGSQIAQVVFSKLDQDLYCDLDLLKKLVNLEARNLAGPFNAFIDNMLGTTGEGELSCGSNGALGLVLERMSQDPEIFLESVLATTKALWTELTDAITDYAAMDDDERSELRNHIAPESFLATEASEKVWTFGELFQWLNKVDLSKLSEVSRGNLREFFEGVVKDWNTEIECDGSLETLKSVYQECGGSYIMNTALDAIPDLS